MTKVPYNGEQYGAAQVAAYLTAQSVLQRVNTVVPGRWRQEFEPVPADLIPAGERARCLCSRRPLSSGCATATRPE